MTSGIEMGVMAAELESRLDSSRNDWWKGAFL